VLAAHIEAFIEFSNKHNDTHLTPDDYSEHWGEVWAINHDAVERRALEFHTPEIVGNFGVIDEAERALRSLKKHSDLIVVTARPKHTIDTTNIWLKQHFQGVFSDVHFVPVWEPNNKVTKADICKNIGADYLIDDLIRHCNVAADSGITALLFGEYGWKQREEIHPEVIRVKNWQEVLEYFDGRS
jgi:5'(3')-deoxyribonucleotidase